jgi:hypothetical protein
VFLKDFLQDYEKFNRMYRTVNPVPVTKRAMVAMGVTFERQSLNVIISGETCRVHLNKVDAVMHKPPTEIWTRKWYFYDIIAVVLHIGLVMLLLYPVAHLMIFQNNLQSELSSRPVD